MCVPIFGLPEERDDRGRGASGPLSSGGKPLESWPYTHVNLHTKPLPPGVQCSTAIPCTSVFIALGPQPALLE